MRHARGFTMVELVVAMGIIGILAAIAAPAARGIIENGRIRAVGESMGNALALSRAEAVRLNTQVAFVASAAGWTVQRVDDGTQLHSGTGKESAQNALRITYRPVLARTVTFDAFGRVVDPNPDGTNAILQINIASRNPSGLASYRPLRVQVLASGLARLCDPSAAGTEPRACL
jgi:prepilin-type N-terminal cleavage/methylation domain-containing protein